MKGVKFAPDSSATALYFKRSLLHRFNELKFRTCDDGFRSQQKKRLLSGDGWAVFERVLHGGTSDRRVQGSEVMGYEGWFLIKLLGSEVNCRQFYGNYGKSQGKFLIRIPQKNQSQHRHRIL